jgi:hypothetical protein
MGTELALSPQRELTPAIWQMVKELGPMLHKSRLFGVASEEQAIAIMLKGHELGLGFTASFEYIQVIQGKPTLKPQGALALIYGSPFVKSVKITRLANDKGVFVGYECYMQRTNGTEHTERFTMDDAKRAGLVKPDSGWVNYPENMCKWRSIGFCADTVFPDVTAGMTGLMKMPEKFGVSLSEDGNIIEGVVKDAPVAPQQPTQQAQSTNDTELSALCDLYGAEAVWLANGGAIPQGDQIAEVATKLATKPETKTPPTATTAPLNDLPF